MTQATELSAQTLPEILNQLRALRDVIKSQYKANVVGVFGSFARQEQTSDSDLDILVYFEPGATLFDIVELEYFLLDKLGVKPDIVSERGIKPRIKPYVLKDLIKI